MKREDPRVVPPWPCWRVFWRPFAHPSQENDCNRVHPSRGDPTRPQHNAPFSRRVRTRIGRRGAPPKLLAAPPGLLQTTPPLKKGWLASPSESNRRVPHLLQCARSLVHARPSPSSEGSARFRGATPLAHKLGSCPLLCAGVPVRGGGVCPNPFWPGKANERTRT